ncbi:MAG: DUF3108 domain-containing protein [Rhodocyclales bacterium]|nr:DUF3108 domain-containing protein [Rhodocyclales bacterium]
MSRLWGVRMLLCLALMLCGVAAEADGAAASSASWASSGRVVFDVLRGEGGMKLGRAEHRWSHDGARYSMETSVEAAGVVGVLLDDFYYTQSSRGRIVDGWLQPERFEVDQAGRGVEFARFDWGGAKVAITRKGKITHYPLNLRDQDVLSVWHLGALLGGRDLPGEIALVTNRRAEPALLQVLGAQRVTLPIGQVDAIKIRARARSGKLTIDLWLSQAHRLAPVRIVMTDKKGSVLDQQAVSIELEGALPSGGAVNKDK